MGGKQDHEWERKVYGMWGMGGGGGGIVTSKLFT